MEFMDVDGDKQLSLESEDSTSNPGKRKPGRKKLVLIPPKASASCQTPPEMKRVFSLAPKLPSRFLNGFNPARNGQGPNSPAAPPPPPPPTFPLTSTSTSSAVNTHDGGLLANVNGNEPPPPLPLPSTSTSTSSSVENNHDGGLLANANGNEPPPTFPLPSTSTSTSSPVENNHDEGLLANVNGDEVPTATAAAPVASTAEPDRDVNGTEPPVVVEVEVTSSSSTSSTPPSPGDAGSAQSQTNDVEVVGRVPIAATSSSSSTSTTSSSSLSSASGSGSGAAALGDGAGDGGGGGGDQEVPPPLIGPAPAPPMSNALVLWQPPSENLQLSVIEPQQPHPQMGLMPRYTFGGDWRDNLPDGYRLKRMARDPRMEHLLDAHFKVGPEREVIKAHRVVLGANCQYFEDYFSRRNISRGVCMVFPTLDPGGFKFMIDYMYTKVLNFLEFAANMDLLQVARLVLKGADCARHIGYAEFEKLMVNYMHTQIKKDNALPLVVLFRLMGRPWLEAVALGFLNLNTKEAILSPHFLQLSEEGLASFLSCDYWYLPEMEVFEAGKNWALHRILYGGEHYEGTREVQITSQMIRDALGAAFYQIRFLLLRVEDFTKILTNHPGMFSPIEMGNIMEYLISPMITAPPEPYVARPRIQPPPPPPPPPPAIEAPPSPSAALPAPPPETNDASTAESPEQLAPPPPESPPTGSETPTGSVAASVSPTGSVAASVSPTGSVAASVSATGSVAASVSATGSVAASVSPTVSSSTASPVPSPAPLESNGQDKSISNEQDADEAEAEKSEREPRESNGQDQSIQNGNDSDEAEAEATEREPLETSRQDKDQSISNGNDENEAEAEKSEREPRESNGQDQSIQNGNDSDEAEAERTEREPMPHCRRRGPGRPSRTQQQASAAATAHKSQRRKRRYKSRAFAGPAAKKRKMTIEVGKAKPDFCDYVTKLAATTDTVALAESTTIIQGHFTLTEMPSGRIYLPNIKNFFLNLDPPQKTPSGEDLRAAMKSNFSRLSNLIFFDLSMQRSTKRLGGLMRQIFAKKINLTIAYYGATIVKVCHSTGTLTMTMLSDAQEILNICCQSDFELKNLAVHECRLWKLNMVKWDKLDSVVMNGVDGVSNWREIVRNCKRVSRFVCDGLGGQKLDIYSDVLKGKENLRKIYFGHTTLTCKNLNFPVHEGLRELYLDSVTCPEDFVQEFPRVFPNVKRMLMFELNECEPLALFHLIQMPALEFIHVWDIKKPTDERALDIQRLRVLLGEIFDDCDFAKKTDLPFMIRLTTEGKKNRAAAAAVGSSTRKTRPFDPFDGNNWSGKVISQDPSSTDADEEVEKVYKLDYSQGSYEEFFDCFETFYLWETAPDETDGGTDTEETEAGASPANGRA